MHEAPDFETQAVFAPESSLAPATAEASQPYVGRWNRLTSTTNWEKGRIIAQWREALELEGLAITEYSDEAWATLVGGVTGQHAGRLRRVYQRFHSTQENFTGLYWSHFQAALDWADAEMWLEGAVQNAWSVNGMRRSRWETLGALPEHAPQAEDIISTETDEDFEPARNEVPATISGRYGEVQGPNFGEGPDFGDGGDASSDRSKSFGDEARTNSDYAASTPQHGMQQHSAATQPAVRPFANLPSLPDDVAEAFEQYKLVILRHRSEGWSDISLDDMLVSLDSLKQLATAPSDNPIV